MSTPDGARAPSPAPARVCKNRSAKINADAAVSIYRAKLMQSQLMGSDLGMSARCAAKHGITPKAVRDIWNLRTWAAATMPYWTHSDRERWARKRGQAPGSAGAGVVVQATPQAPPHLALAMLGPRPGAQIGIPFAAPPFPFPHFAARASPQLQPCTSVRDAKLDPPLVPEVGEVCGEVCMICQSSSQLDWPSAWT